MTIEQIEHCRRWLEHCWRSQIKCPHPQLVEHYPVEGFRR